MNQTGTSQLNHVAILVSNLLKSRAKLHALGFDVGKSERFESEGTEEVYIGGPNRTGRLLLMQAIGPGPYEQALRKQGPSLHHVCIDVPNLNLFLKSIERSGWHLHPKSFETYNSIKTVWLVRAGEPIRIEVHEIAQREVKEPLITQMHAQMSAKGQLLFDALGIANCHMCAGTPPRILMGSIEVLLADLL